MTLSRRKLLGIAHAERQRLGRMCQYADPGTWEMPSAADGWWNRDVMAHLAAHDTAAAQLVGGEPAQELDEFRSQSGGDAFSVDAFNAWTVNRRSGLSEREVIETWGRAAGSFVELCSRLSDEEWERNRYPWLAGDIAAKYLLQSRIVEWFLHGEDMRATNGVSAERQRLWQHWPAYLTIDMGIRMLPWALDQAGLDLSGHSVQVDVSGPGSGSWHWGLGAGQEPTPDKKPDALIVGRAPQLALIAGRRLSVDDALDSGNILLGADAGLAEQILRAIRAYP